MDHDAPTHSQVKEAEEGEDGFGEDCSGDGKHHVEEGEGQQVRDDVDEDDAGMTASGDFGRLDVGLDLDGEGLGLEDYGGAAEASQDADDEGEIEEIQMEEGAQDYEEGDAGKGNNEVGEAHEEGVHEDRRNRLRRRPRRSRRPR